MLAPARIAVRPEQIDRLEVEEGPDAEDGEADEAVVAVPTMFPSAIGLSFCLVSTTSELEVRARWGCYRKEESERGFKTATGGPKKVWKRRQVDETVTVALPGEGAIGPYPVGGEAGLPVAPAEIRGIVRGLRGTRVVSLFLVNRMQEPEQNRDEAWIFQPELSVEASGAPVFVSPTGGGLAEHLDSEERILAMGLRNRRELAVGHGVSVHAELSPEDPMRAIRLATRVVPEAEVRRQESRTPEDDPMLAPLSLEQFQRASALICACEVLRREEPEAFGQEPFRIGLWVGSRSTPNRTDHADEVLRRSRDTGSPRRTSFFGMGSPVQLKSCPWCGSTIEPGRHMKVRSYGSGSGRTLTFCGDKSFACPFTERHAPREGLPVVVVDEEIYRRLPSLLIATVDKFAQMPWNGIVQMLFGRVEKICDRHGFSASDLDDANHPKRRLLPRTTLRDHPRLRPPDLIIQDELHLISGPLGTMTGLYETAVDSLCAFELDGKRIRPKIVASTATIRRAEQQIHALFLRNVRIFPPQGLDAEDNFFAVERREDWGRRYIGLCAPGKRLKAAVIRVYVAFLAAAQHLYERYGSRADPFMTLVGYFSSLRELAGTRRLVDDDISSRLRRMDRRGLARRRIGQPWELTSRMGSTEIPALLDRLERRFEARPGAGKKKGGKRSKAIDVLLATNMISVGVDVRRLGLMVVLGQPKNTAEYIQATSRVGRAHPGIVCTIYNWARPRDLSHYETFAHYHRTFYRKVEALSVTPFAVRAIDRGLSAILVALVRLTGDRFSRNKAAADMRKRDPLVSRAVEEIAQRAELVEQKASVGRMVRAMLLHRLDVWESRALRHEGGTSLGYRTERDAVTVGLLERAGADPFTLFTCPDSLRNVEAPVELVLEDGGSESDAPPFRKGLT